MRERLKRGKKGESSTPAQKASTPAPLQPKFYDNEPSPAKPEPEESAAEAPEAETLPELESEPGGANEPSETPAATRPARRRRRGRGRRGSSRPQAAATAPPTAEQEPSAPEPMAAAAVPEPVPAPPPASKGTVVLAIGLPGSGKSSWFKRHNIRPLSSDLLRELLFDDAQEQRFQDLVFSNLRSMLKARLIARRPLNYVDATNLSPHDRHSWIKLAKDYGYEVHGVFFDVPLEVCLERNQRRNRAVDGEIMRKMAGKLKAPTFDEGFSKITVVRVKQKE